MGGESAKGKVMEPGDRRFKALSANGMRLAFPQVKHIATGGLEADSVLYSNCGFKRTTNMG